VKKKTFFTHCYRDIIKHKVVSKPNEKIKTEPFTTTSKRSLKYPSLETTLAFDFNSAAFLKRMKKTGPAFVVMKILQKFREDEKRDPMPENRDEDTKKLLALRDSMSNATTIPDAYFDHVFAQLSPCSAIVGGAVAQEVIKVSFISYVKL
jgi:ubiquitin-like 1-activating enzyme E1 A